MQQVTGLESSLVVVIQALVILFLIWDPLRRRLHRKTRVPEPEGLGV